MNYIFTTMVSIFLYLSTTMYGAQLEVKAVAHEKMSLVVCALGASSEIIDVAQTIAADFSFSGQCVVTVQKWHKKKVTQESIKHLYDQGYALALFVNKKKKKYIEWRLYDTMDDQLNMLAGKRYNKKGTQPRGWAHTIADAVWPLITGEKSFFSSKLAYCIDGLNEQKKRITKVCIADFDGSHPQIIVDVPTISIAPRWNNDLLNPLLFYSEHTNKNLRLMVVDMNKRRHVASNFDGINMLPAFSADGKRVVYCASRGDGECHIYLYDKNTFKKLTNNNGNNVSPTLSSNGSILYFCSDFQTGHPQIYALNIDNNALERLTTGGYCASPSYSGASHKVVYCKIVQGTAQLFVYDCSTKKHAQLTTDSGNKEECTWSPCGNYIVFSHQKGKKNVIAMLNVLTGERKILIDNQLVCSYPTWSPLYDLYPVVND